MKRNHAIFIATLITALFLIFGCDDSEKPARPKPDSEALHTFIDENIAEQSQQFTIDAEDGGQIKGDQGTVIQFFSNSFLTMDGDPVTGSVNIELIEIYNRSAMVLTQKPTVGKMDNGDLAVLVSGGEFYVNATQNGNPLKPASGYSIIAPTEKTGGADEDMRIFTGVDNCIDDVCNNVWEEEKDRGMEIGQFQPDGGGVYSAYYCFQSKFGWTNIDKWYSDPRPKTTIYVDVPEGFDNTNCAVFIVYDGEPTALGRMDTYDEETGLFSEHYGLIPIGLEVHFVLVSIIEDEIHYAIQGTTITENHIEVINDVQSITKEELIDLIDELP
ncbi:MAG TPA: hypothetical protein VGK59_21930 [Ohtaekwangia sp.]